MSDTGTDVKELTPLQRGQKRLQEMRANGELPPRENLTPVERAKRNPNSLKRAITAHCWTCCGSGADPGVKQSVRDCQIVDCSLWPHRPWQKVSGKSADQMTEDEIEQASGAVQDHADDEDDQA